MLIKNDSDRIDAYNCGQEDHDAMMMLSGEAVEIDNSSNQNL